MSRLLPSPFPHFPFYYCYFIVVIVVIIFDLDRSHATYQDETAECWQLFLSIRLHISIDMFWIGSFNPKKWF